eukprot:1157186-Pelagomonas_calceolata.AAC.4
MMLCSWKGPEKVVTTYMAKNPVVCHVHPSISIVHKPRSFLIPDTNSSLQDAPVWSFAADTQPSTPAQELTIVCRHPHASNETRLPASLGTTVGRFRSATSVRPSWPNCGKAHHMMNRGISLFTCRSKRCAIGSERRKWMERLPQEKMDQRRRYGRNQQMLESRAGRPFTKRALKTARVSRSSPVPACLLPIGVKKGFLRTIPMNPQPNLASIAAPSFCRVHARPVHVLLACAEASTYAPSRHLTPAGCKSLAKRGLTLALTHCNFCMTTSLIPPPLHTYTPTHLVPAPSPQRAVCICGHGVPPPSCNAHNAPPSQRLNQRWSPSVPAAKGHPACVLQASAILVKAHKREDIWEKGAQHTEADGNDFACTQTLSSCRL